MKNQMPLMLAGLALISAPVAALACEPIVPFVKAIGGPRALTASLAVLGVVVLLKCAAFARFQKALSFQKALLWMLAANVVTSIIGLTIPAMVESGGAVFIAVPIVWALCLLPAQRLIAAAPLTRLARYTPGQLAFGMTAALVLSYLLFIMSRMVRDSDNFALYWIIKFPAVYGALIIGIALTAFWEEWIVWRFSRAEEEDLTFVPSVIRANAVVLAVVMLVSAGVMIPKRFKSTAVVAAERPELTQQSSQSSTPTAP